jgi:hypothetical protein
MMRREDFPVGAVRDSVTKRTILRSIVGVWTNCNSFKMQVSIYS